MKTLKIIFFTFALTGFAFSQSSVFLFDNSGSMSGFYREQNSSFKSFCRILIKNAVGQNENVNIMLFTKTDTKRGITSPKSLYSGNSKDLVAEQILENFKMMRGNDDGFGTTDLIEAFDKGVESIKENTGIIWLVTDNINDNSGSGDSSYFNTLEFYKRLRSDVNIRKILLFPLPEKVSEAGYTSNGYVVYSIVYSKTSLGQADLDKYDKYIRSVGIKQKAITLKPLDVGTIVLVPKVSQSKITPGKLFFDGKTLRGFDFEEGEKIKEVFNDLSLKSNLYPHIIKSAKLDVHLENFTSSDYSVKSLGTQSISPSTVSNVTPEGEVTGFSVTFNMPEISPTFSFNTIFKDDFTVGGNLILEVSGVDIALEENYTNNFRELFALQSIPEIFQPVLKDKKIITQIPLEIKMKYGPWRLFVLIGLIVVILGLIIFLLIFLLKKKVFTIVINNSLEQVVALNALSSFPVYSDLSEELGKIKKTLFSEIRFTHSKRTKNTGLTEKLNEGIPVAVEYEDDNMRTVSSTVMLKESLSKDSSKFSESKEEFY